MSAWLDPSCAFAFLGRLSGRQLRSVASRRTGQHAQVEFKEWEAGLHNEAKQVYGNMQPLGSGEMMEVLFVLVSGKFVWNPPTHKQTEWKKTCRVVCLFEIWCQISLTLLLWHKCFQSFCFFVVVFFGFSSSFKAVTLLHFNCMMSWPRSHNISQSNWYRYCAIWQESKLLLSLSHFFRVYMHF